MSEYDIHRSDTGELLLRKIELPEGQVENLSSDTPEGHFRAGLLEELIAAGLDEGQSVYALLMGAGGAL